jgi:23S rRNA (pseudouridine1915-N3)-methyltransferase
MGAHVRLLCAGRMKRGPLRGACDDYARMLTKYARVTVEEVDDEPAPDTLSEAQVQEALAREGERLLKRIPPSDAAIALCIDGERMDSPGLAKRLDGFLTRGASRFTFVIGSSLGLGEAVLARADWKLSFSEMTFPHQLVRVLVLEQVFRAFSILAGAPYHK